ncbi:MAG: amidohydrolase family protein, partial [Calditrichaeota bacterium]|nr:amidohydrolase family protein [Calditrichota bacterium]
MNKSEIINIFNSIPLADTHEHLLEEKDRLKNPAYKGYNDIGLLFRQYVESDLIVSGMSERQADLIKDETIPADSKWKIIRQFWPLIRHTGYGMMVRETIRVLYDENDISDSNWKKINDKIAAQVKPGFYDHILKDICNIDHCQVNALDAPLYRKSERADFLMDLCVSRLCSDFDVILVQDILQRPPEKLDDCIEAIDRSFLDFGPKSIAVKNQSAYRRKIDYNVRELNDVKQCFNHCREKDWQVNRTERKALEDFLVYHTIKKATESGLPYKMHTGYHSGHGTMPLHNLRHNAGDMSNLCRLHPESSFVFMHINYPHQDELIALAKHYPNAYVDMCWSWMISPLAAVRFLKEFLTAVP